MNKKRYMISIIFIIIFLTCLYLIYISNPDEIKPVSNNYISELEEDINNGLSIMGIWPHPDDEVYTPGIFVYAADKGNTCWIVHLISLDSVPIHAQESRFEAIHWLKETYLWPNGGDCINLNMSRDKESGGWHTWTWSNETIKAKYKAIIEEKKPDILLTFSPYGSCDLAEHSLISDIVTDIWDELEYKPKIYWFINTDQGPRTDPCGEHEIYTPTDILDLDIYSENLGMTYWEAKVGFLEEYRSSVGGLNRWMNIEGNLESNDRQEYFVRYK